MPPARARGGRFSNFRIPTVSSSAAKLAIAVVAVSLVSALARLQGMLALFPEAVLRELWLWQPLTYAFLAGDPFGVIFSALILWSIGGAMEQTWGSRRVLTFAVGGTVLAGVLTVLLGLLVGPIRASGYIGAWVMADMVWIAYGLSIGRGQANFWGLPVSGNALAGIGFGFIILRGAFSSFYAVVPELLGAGMAFAYSRGVNPRLLWLRFQSWRLHSQLKGRSKHLRVISRERNMPSDSDRYLH